MTHTPNKLKLAYISPLPPSRSGIADYSAMLLPALEKYYEIEVVVEHEVSDEWVKKTLPIRDVAWFKAHADDYERVIYHFGNSSSHYHMFNLIECVPGVVVLHDFFLGHAVSGMDALGIRHGYWSQSLYESHGQLALNNWFKTLHLENLQAAYPVNKQILKNAYGVIVHTQQSKQLADTCYEQHEANNWAVIPLTRNLPNLLDPIELRERYGFKQTDFLVCSFGMLGANKLNDRLLSTWLKLDLIQNASIQLIFVGENDNGDFGRQLAENIAQSGHADHIKITGWVSESTYHDYLTMADIAVQLRGASKGEMSAAALDCMAYALPTIVNAQGGLAEISKAAVCQLKADFSDDELALALNDLVLSKDRRQILSAQARLEIERYHSPQECAHQYAIHIESFYEARAGKAELVIASESNLIIESKHWSLIKQLRQTHHDSEADLYLRMNAHHQMLEGQLATLNHQLDLTKKEHIGAAELLKEAQQMLTQMQEHNMVAEVKLRHTTKAVIKAEKSIIFLENMLTKSEKVLTNTLNMLANAEKVLAITQKTHDDLVSSRSWRVTMLIRHWYLRIKTTLAPMRGSLSRTKAWLKAGVKISLNFFWLVLGSWLLTHKIKNQLTYRFPAKMQHLKLFVKSMPPRYLKSDMSQELTQSEQDIYERLKLVIEDTQSEGN